MNIKFNVISFTINISIESSLTNIRTVITVQSPICIEHTYISESSGHIKGKLTFQTILLSTSNSNPRSTDRDALSTVYRVSPGQPGKGWRRTGRACETSRLLTQGDTCCSAPAQCCWDSKTGASKRNEKGELYAKFH